ncbi:cell wall biogenesis and architecture protein [Microbotryomycetes sp. JL221]|nr:cell wall biogenesis and architecture protein [Microbotryomycetes sp. JL221]
MSTGSVGRAIQQAVRHSCSHPPARPSPSDGQRSAPPRKKRTIMDLTTFKRKNIPITMLTAHDYPSARFIEQAGSTAVQDERSPVHASGDESASTTAPTHKRGVDICLVGDSLAMVACGYTSTTSLTLDEMLYHCRSVARGCHSSLLVADMPFGTYSVSPEEAMRNAIKIIQDGDMDAVKIEGGEEIRDIVHHLTSRGIPVMAHIGLTPQRQSALSGYRVQGKTVQSALKVWKDAQILQEAGAFSILVEAVPHKLGEWISERLEVPTIGIGAGNGCDGQVLVQLDMLGVSSLSKGPRFLKHYGDMELQATSSIQSYIQDVRAREFPNNEQQGYPVADEQWHGFLQAVNHV